MTREAVALNQYLGGPVGDSQATTIRSSFEAVLSDARRATGRNPQTGASVDLNSAGNWLGLVGYLTLLDQIGTAVHPRRRGRINSQSRAIHRALLDWAPKGRLSHRDRQAIYGLRNAIIHDFSLFNLDGPTELRFRFRLDHAPSEDIIIHASRRFRGSEDLRESAVTTVYVRELCQLVDDIAEHIKAEHRRERVSSRLPATILALRYTIVSGPGV